jgi:carbonic anhydrase
MFQSIFIISLTVLILKEVNGDSAPPSSESSASTSAMPEQNHSWNYLDFGPDEWPFLFTTCAGSQQSPIDIAPSTAKFDSSLKPFVFNNYNKSYDFNFYFNGHSVVMAPLASSSVPSVSGSNYNGAYNLAQFHFHWGYSNNQGSEHTWNNMKFPLEVHLVHKNNAGQLTVLGFFFQISNSNNPMLDPIINAISSNLNGSILNVTIPQFNILNLIGTPEQINPSGYFRYAGSLTTPPCSEGVIWNVFERKIQISANQMALFRKNFPMQTFRTVQELKQRTVYSSRCQPSNINDVCNGATTPVQNILCNWCSLVFKCMKPS